MQLLQYTEGKGCQTPSQAGLTFLLEGGGGYSQPKRPDCFSSGCEASHGDQVQGLQKELWGPTGDPGEGLRDLASMLTVLLAEDHREDKQLLRNPRPVAGEWQNWS